MPPKVIKTETKTVRVAELLSQVDVVMAKCDGHRKVDKYDLLRRGVLHSESDRRMETSVEVGTLLMHVLPPKRHCVINSVRTSFHKAMFSAKMAELAAENRPPIVKMHMNEPRLAYFLSDVALAKQVLTKEMVQRAVVSTRFKATSILKDLADDEDMTAEADPADAAPAEPMEQSEVIPQAAE